MPELTTLYAIEYVDIDTRELFNQLVSRERKGIEAMIKAHQQYIKQSKDDFKDNPLNYIKGYTPDVMNPYRALEWIPDDADTIKAYENKGWVRVDDKDALTQDNLDKTDARVLMFHKDINYQRRVSGALDTIDTHSKGTVVEKINKLTEKIPDSLKTATDWLMLNPNTPVYQFLAEATQFSDFGAKYVLAKHLQGKGVGLTKAISEAQDTFINFDMPTGQGLDYLNRMGIVMFTKFFLRFQRVLSKMFMQKPAQMMAQHMGMEHLFSQAGILDPAMPLRIGNNPFEASAFSIFGASNDVLTMDVITGIW